MSHFKGVGSLDPGVAARQSIGLIFSRPEKLDATIAAYREGTLRLPPHPAWKGDATQWTADPFEDKNWRFQHHTLRWLNPLRWAALEGDDEARVEWLRVARSWAEANVPADHSGSDFAWKDMADGNRAVQLSLGVPLADPEDTWLVDLLDYHRDWLMDEKHIVGKNHGLHQHIGLMVVGAALRDTPAVGTAVERMREQFSTTFDEQGTNDEGSASYHQMNIRWWTDAWERAQLEGCSVPSEVQDRLRAASVVLAHIAQPDGELPQIGDSARVRVKLGMSETADFVASSGELGRPPAEIAAVFDGGYICSRSGWGDDGPPRDESHALIRHGKELLAHSHRDRGSLHIYAAGQRWLIDSGFYNYHAGAPNNAYLKSREAHNVALLPGVRHDDNAPVDLVSQHIDDDVHDFTLLDRGYPDANVRRRVTYFTGADFWLVVDTAQRDFASSIKQHWHVEPGSRLRNLDNGFWIMGEESRLGIHWLGRDTQVRSRRADDRSFAGWIGTKWKTLTPSLRLTAESTGPTPRLVTLIAPQGTVPFGIANSYVARNGNMTLDVVRGGTFWSTKLVDGEFSVARRGA